MFPPSADPPREVGEAGGSGGLLLPTHFWWRYGGRQVFLTGSFTRWTEHIPMSPVDGCPSVFQAVCNLPPGLHQYKYYVDGVWRHDEQEPFEAGSFGEIVNTLLVTPREVDQMSPSILNPGTSSRDSNMEVDNENLSRLVTVPDRNIVDGSNSTVIQSSRSRISDYLTTTTAFDLLPESGKVVALDINMPVKQSFHILHEQGIPVAPLWDSNKGQFVGILSPSDFILILRQLETHGSNLTEEELDTHSISAWKEEKHQLYGNMDGHRRRPHYLVYASPYDSLKDVALKILQNDVSTVPVIYSSSEDGSFPQLLHLASLSGILKRICRYYKHSGALAVLQQPICMLPLGTWIPRIGDPTGHPLAMLRPNASLNSALSLLVQAQVSSIPIVDDNDSLLDIYSRSDITALAKDKVYARIQLNEISIHQALQLGQDASSPYGFYNGQRCQMCLRSDSLMKVMERLAVPGVRRVIIVEAGSKRVEGIISLSDVFKFLLG